MNLQPLQHLLHGMVGARVLVVGDVMLDRFVYGDVSRVSAEAPVPILAHTREIRMLGGAGNVARNIVALGGRVELVGLVGLDPSAMEVEALLAEDAIGNGLVADSDRCSTVKMRFASAGQQLLRVDTEVVLPAPPQAERALETRIRTRAPGCGAILLSDYGKGVVTPAVIDACLAASRETGARLVVDSKARRFGHYGPVDLVKPNAAELSRATDLPTETDVEVEAALAKALETCEARAILVTRAAKGMSLAVRGEPVRHFSRPPPEVFDTAGAGDTALAAVGLALASSAPVDAAVELALVASSLVVQKAGVAVVSPDEIIEAELAASRSPLDAKIATPERMAREAARWRSRGLRVGFTNGCFDVLHAGHIAYLTQARSWCDRLIVGLNTDDSIRAAKGPGRPVNGLEARARVLSALAAVDLVTPFEEETPLELIRAARPDLLVKGGDYTPEAIVGRDLVLSWGGEVRVADFVEGHSTTSVIRRLGGGGRQ
ncbi:MAG: D-glycero-beta-D-manno-heptose 1-phosphate adenylyltransferase [Caulobacteraceae bacterium]|nr:D-glycero-beta-D-manno-heptose 1-phosphate adenylyltransferase [Caulobacteraceae bacterium]